MSKLTHAFNKVACPDAPKFFPGKWHRESYQRFNNCYAYAVDDYRTTRHFPQPGEACGRPPKKISKQEVARAAIRDGLLWTKEPVQKKGCYLVALLVSEGNDYHWIRQDMDGGWSHKSGDDRVSRLDFDDQPIDFPHLSEWEGYKFACYFHVPKGGIRVERRVLTVNFRAPVPMPKGFRL